MHIFHHKQKEETIRSVFHMDDPLDKSNWHEVFSACLGGMTAIQYACGEQVVKHQDWNLDFTKGTITFGKSSYPIQFIGSEAESSHSWLWGWENINHFDASLLKLANQVKKLGEQWKLEPFTMAEFELNDTFQGHTLSIAACALSDTPLCYYRCPHAHGAVFVAFSQVPDSVFAPIESMRFVELVMSCIQQYPVDHKIFIESFLTWNQTAYEWKEMTLTAHFQNDLLIEFETIEDLLRIKRMHRKP